MRDLFDQYRETVGTAIILASVGGWMVWMLTRVWVLETGATTTWQWALIVPAYIGATLSDGGVFGGRDLNNSRQP